MEDLCGTTPSSAAGMASESEDITNILNQLLQSSSSSSSSISPFFTSAPSSSSSFAAFKAKYAHFLNSPPPHHQPPSFSDDATVSAIFGSEFGRSENRSEPEPSSAAGSSGFGFTDPARRVFSAEVKDGVENAFADSNTALKGRRISPENDLGDFSCDSEGAEASEVPSNSAHLPRGSSKRSRAAEVHNLSEKRRRSRINEKMKALQNLIPNSNKTDKASMLDEAIEYLKQLQIQVQMLSMRNGLSLHPMCSLPGVVQPMQLTLPQTGLGFGEGIKFPNPNGIGISAFSGHEETLMQPAPFNLSSISNQPLALPPVANAQTSEASLGFEQPTQTRFRPVNLTPSAAELCDEGKPQGASNTNTLPSKSLDA